MLVVRVETDWYSHETEFRYVLQAGEGITVEHTIPIGQVMFIPREEVNLLDATGDDVKTFEEGRNEFREEESRDAADDVVTGCRIVRNIFDRAGSRNRRTSSAAAKNNEASSGTHALHASGRLTT